MFSDQQLYNLACDSLRTYGNPYGSLQSRGWSWINENDPTQRCAIGKFIGGCKQIEVKNNLLLQMENPSTSCDSLVGMITFLFDHYPSVCNNKSELEHHLKGIADTFKLEYKIQEQILTKKETIEFA